MQYVKGFLLAILTMLKLHAESTVSGTLDLCKVALLKTNIVPNADTVWGDLSESSFTGYARSAAVTWSSGHISGQTNNAVMAGDAKTFICTGSDVEETVFGYAIVTAATPPVLLAVRMFDEPIQLGVDNELVILPRISLGQTAIIPSGDVALS